MPAIEPILIDLPDEIPGERVLLRPYRPGDGAAVFEAVAESREHLRPWMPWVDSHRTVNDSEAFARRSAASWLGREDLPIAIWSPDGARLLGSSGLHVRSWDVPHLEVGYWLRRSAEGHGYVAETVRLLARLAFETLGANRLDLRCDARNQRSAAVARRLGFVHEATLRSNARDHFGALRDTLVFALTSQDYQEWPGRL
jgi:RimJ/RimL family protein N-acetyltransferase